MRRRILMTWTYHLFAIGIFIQGVFDLWVGNYRIALWELIVTMLLTLVIAARFNGWNVDRDDIRAIRRLTIVVSKEGTRTIMTSQSFKPGDPVYTVYVKDIGERAITKPWTPNDLPIGKAISIDGVAAQRWVTVDINEGVSL